MAEDVRDNAILVLEIGYYDGADARTSGTAIERLANAFAQETRVGRDRYGLELVRVEIASLHAWFDLGKTLLDLYDQRALLGNFLQTVAVAIETVMNAGGGSGAISASVRSFLVSLAAPIVRKQAEHAKLYVKGDNNTIIYIEAVQAERIDRLFDAPRRVRGGGGFLAAPVDEALLRQWQAGEVLGRKRGVNDPVQDDDESAVPRLTGTGPKAVAEADARLIRLGREWYARPAGMQGVLLPVVESETALKGLDESRSYTASGSVVRSGGNPTGFRVRIAVVDSI